MPFATDRGPAQGSGYAVFALDTSARTIEYYISYTLSGGHETGAHLHGFAPAGEDAKVLYALPSDQAGTKRGLWAYGNRTAPANETANETAPNGGQGVWVYGNETDVLALELGFAQGLVYVQIHSEAHPEGEIRGQLVARPPIRQRYTFAIEMTAARVAGVPSASKSSAFGMMMLQTDTGAFQYFIDYYPRDEGSTVENVSLHGFSPPGASSGLIHPRELRSSPQDTSNPPRIGRLMAIGMIEGMAYLQMYSDLFPGGALRGQVLVAERDYSIVVPWSEGTAPAGDGASGVLLPVHTFPKEAGVAASMVAVASSPPAGMVAYTREMHVEIRPLQTPEQPIVFTVAGLQYERRLLGDRHVNPAYRLSAIYWYNSTSEAWVEALGTSFDETKDVSVVTIGLDVLSDPGFTWRLVGMRAEDEDKGASSGAGVLAAIPWISAALACALFIY